MLAGAGVAIGVAWSGMLGNFAAGAFMLVLRPIKVGDFVQVGGLVAPSTSWACSRPRSSRPTMSTPWSATARSSATRSRISRTPGASCRTDGATRRSVDPLDAIARFKAAVAQIPNVATDPAPEVNLLDINLVGTVIAVRPYCHTDHYWQVYFDTNEAIVRVCKEAGWPAPTPTQIMKTMAA